VQGCAAASLSGREVKLRRQNRTTDRTAGAVVFMCGPLSAGLSGGDVHALRLVAHWNQHADGSALLVAPELMRRHLVPGDEDALLPLRTPLDRFLRGLVSYVPVLLLRTLRACVDRCPPAGVAIASSHFFHDVVPCAVHRLRYGSRSAVYVYHLVADMERATSLRSMLSRRGERLSIALLRRSRSIVFVDNEQTRESLISYGIAPNLVVDTQNAYDPPGGVPLGDQVDNSRVAFCGRFVEEKGIWDMFDLARRLTDLAPHAQVTMLGDGPQRQRFLTALADEGLQNVDAPGFAPESDKWRLLTSAGVFAAPSREEGWGIAVGEALLAGLPVVVYDLPAYGHLGDVPIRVPVGDRQLFIETVISLLSEPDRLAAERRRAADAAVSLPRWAGILGREIDRMRSSPGTE
jgi:glycosyltransferase involved in cell wall biosynthesis